MTRNRGPISDRFLYYTGRHDRYVVPEETGHQRILDKVTFHIIPFAFILYIVAFIDRVNLGYAALTMNADIGVSPEVYGFLSGIFFIGYLLFEVPSNLIMQWIGARIWIARILISWGIIATITGFVTDASQLVVLRFLLGIAEAGFFPGMIWYLGTWFPPERLARSIALFMTAIGVSNIIGSPVSMFILDTVSWFDLPGWRWLFILEGIPAILFGFLALKVMNNSVMQAAWLSPDEKTWLSGRLKDGSRAEKTSYRLMKVLTDRRLFICSWTYFAMSVGLYAIIFFLPTRMKELFPDLNLTILGVIMVIPYLIAVTGMLLSSRHSDRTGERRFHTATAMSLGGIGLIIAAAVSDPIISFVAMSLALAGIFAMYGPFWSFVLSLLTPAEQPAGVAAVNSIGNSGGFFGPALTGILLGLTGTMLEAFLIIAVILIAGGIAVLFVREGKKKMVS